MTQARPASSPPVFDGHNDLLLRLWLHQSDDAVGDFLHRSLEGHLDMARIRQGGFAGGLFAVFVPPAHYVRQHNPAYDERSHSPLAITDAQIALLHQVAERSQGQARVCQSAEETEKCIADGVLAMVLHIEGAEALDAECSQLEGWIAAGLRSIGPLWNLQNVFGHGVTGAFPGSPDSGEGLTAAGLNLLRLCNQHKLLIDLSHMNEKAFWQTARLSSAPLVASHSNAHTLCPQPRNLTDRQLDAIAASDGFVGVNFGNAFLRADGKRDGSTPLSEIIRHLDWLLNRLGEEGVGLGSDFDGISVPEQLGDVAGLPRLIAAMTSAGYSSQLIEKICWRNWLRVLKKTWGK